MLHSFREGKKKDQNSNEIKTHLRKVKMTDQKPKKNCDHDFTSLQCSLERSSLITQ